jgi:hypothetical protein
MEIRYVIAELGQTTQRPKYPDFGLGTFSMSSRLCVACASLVALRVMKFAPALNRSQCHSRINPSSQSDCYPVNNAMIPHDISSLFLVHPGSRHGGPAQIHDMSTLLI